MSFYLVGSRFFGTHRENSDWDYLGEDTPSNREACEKMGLRKIPTEVSGATRYWGYGIDICLVTDLARKLYARDEAAKIPGIEKLSKQERHQKLKELAQWPE